MKTYRLAVAVVAWEGYPVVKDYVVKANSFDMAAGMCKGQAAINGWKIVEILNYEVE
jgi:hypothetical protein